MITESQGNIIALGGDRTPVNTGRLGGVFRRIEVEVGKPTHWFVCMFHGIELLLRHYFKFIDGKTSGPSSFSGPTGKQIQNNDLSCLPLVQFKAISGKINPIHNAILETMNTDQKYMFEASLAVQSGYFPISLANMKPGKLHNAR